ncbi:MAG: LamB/YcsF family protein [Chloroflexales bacterium]|nr:LamB/YcsF family protein [Chloroflexales bacterium]
MMKIDLNCDCGESFGPWVMGDDAGILSHVTSANIACGAHAGDPDVMRLTVRLARDLGVGVGAHPGFPDRQGFGRRTMAMPPAEIETSVLAQIGALYAMARAEKVELTHVKPHGALYNYAAATPPAAQAIARAIAAFSRDLILVGLAGSALIDAGQEAGLRVACEAFADRTYEADGALRSRRLDNALIHDNAQSLDQVISIVTNGYALTLDGRQAPIQADTICLHGDTPGATARAAFLRQGLQKVGIEVMSLARVLG